MCTHSFHWSRRNPLQTNCVVKILRVVRINGDDLMPPAIFAPGQFRRRNARPDGPRFVQHLLRKMQRQVVLTQHRQHVHPFLIRRTEHLDDFAFRVGMPRFPFAQLHHDLVADARGPANVTRRRHINVVRHARVVGNYVKKLAAPLQRADDLGPLPFQDANHHARLLLELAGRQSFRPDIATHEHAILVERRGRSPLPES